MKKFDWPLIAAKIWSFLDTCIHSPQGVSFLQFTVATAETLVAWKRHGPAIFHFSNDTFFFILGTACLFLGAPLMWAIIVYGWLILFFGNTLIILQLFRTLLLKENYPEISLIGIALVAIVHFTLIYTLVQKKVFLLFNDLKHNYIHRAERFETHIIGTAYFNNKKSEMEIRNISSTGCLCLCSIELPQNEIALFIPAADVTMHIELEILRKIPQAEGKIQTELENNQKKVFYQFGAHFCKAMNAKTIARLRAAQLPSATPIQPTSEMPGAFSGR